jgi:hypothetical protein
MKFFQIVLLLAIINILKSDFSCTKPGYAISACNGGLGKNSIPCITQRTAIRLAVELNNGVTSQYYGFCLLVDEFSQLIINGSYDFLSSGPNKNNSFVRMWLTDTGVDASFIYKSNQRSYFDLTTANEKIVSFYQLYLGQSVGKFSFNVTDTGISNNIFFENLCTTQTDEKQRTCLLDGSYCIRGADCGGNTKSSTNTNVKILVGWQGTDQLLTPYKSQYDMPSKFTKFSFTPALGFLQSSFAPFS